MKDQEYITLPSGLRCSLDRPDFMTIKTVDDYNELRYALQEKIIDIELQIDLVLAGNLTSVMASGKPYDQTWLPRAKAALKWAKLYRDECQTRLGTHNRRAKDAQQQSLDRRFVTVAREILPIKKFQEIAFACGMLETVGDEENAA